MKKDLTYISLFSCAGVGCYGFKQENFKCVATNEYIQRRLEVQKYNHKCEYETGYICGDIQLDETKNKIRQEINKWGLKGTNVNNSLDLLVATPPCQGMSIANRKQNDKEINRNSLVVESISLIKEFKPNFFVFENVPAFMNTLCINKNDEILSIKDEINKQLSKDYVYLYKVINFKNYGSNSSRTRTLVIGVKRSLANDILPIDIFPNFVNEPTLKETIGDLKSLEWGEIDTNDILHSFRVYEEHMRNWIHGMPEGMSAFDNEDETKRPHKIVNGVIVPHQRKLSGKYTRNSWSKVGPCIHTRNDQMASQNTLHPIDDRVFSIRELMRLMTIPEEFKWIDEDYDYLNSLTLEEKRNILKKHDVNIRQCIGEAVPTNIFRQIGYNIKCFFEKDRLKEKEINELIIKEKLFDIENLISFIDNHCDRYSLSSMLRLCELANSNRESNNAYYTNKEILHEIYNYLPNIDKDNIHILEPAVGLGCMLPILINKYENKKINIDVIDIDEKTILVLKKIVDKYNLSNHNVILNYINDDFIKHCCNKKYDISITNPPFEKINVDKQKVYDEYVIDKSLVKNVNIVSYFIEKMVHISDCSIIITPKNLLSTIDYENTRMFLKNKRIDTILDFGETGFKGVLIETICLFIDKNKKPKDTIVKSITHNLEISQKQSYIMDALLPYWIIYRNEDFDKVFNDMTFDIFNVFRDRQLTNSNTSLIPIENGVRVLKSRNISDNGQEIIDIDNYDSYITKEELQDKEIGKYLDRDDVYLVPNMTYYPRMMKKKKGVVVNGSLAILTLKDEKLDIDLTIDDLLYYSSNEFRTFYNIARNMQTRSLNIDKTSVFFFGIKNKR